MPSPKDRLKALNSKVNSASRKKFPGAVPVMGEGPVPCRLMVIGEAPGRDETRLGRPFVGKAGSFFSSILEEALEMKRDEAYITNVVKIWPNVETRRLRTRKPEDDEREFFAPFLLKEIEIVSPDVILTVGKTAFYALFPGGEFKPGAWTEFGGRKVMAVYHPSYLLRQQKRLKETLKELRRSLALVKKALAS